ncbi:hypothetical protein BC936DRAFT_137860 [Jimgerdemannia flammicorona]|uniref:Uncharacterized protein n=1 Tax=Jimgerdemannia flammicorona TaxID=994334 RepID=A0A433DIX6_9FUNG|nr:hypothetical protein BC936DRAFT_137860 [Jimgerdemannia flammicorona]
MIARSAPRVPQILLHLAGMASFSYSFWTLAHMTNKASASFGWHFQHLTILGLLFSTVTFIILIIRDIMPDSMIARGPHLNPLLVSPLLRRAPPQAPRRRRPPHHCRPLLPPLPRRSSLGRFPLFLPSVRPLRPPHHLHLRIRRRLLRLDSPLLPTEWLLALPHPRKAAHAVQDRVFCCLRGVLYSRI